MSRPALKDRNAAIRRAIRTDLRPLKEVAEEFNISKVRVCQINRRGDRWARVEVSIPRDAWEIVRAESEKRGIGPARLMREIIATVAGDNLFTALFNDGVQS